MDYIRCLSNQTWVLNGILLLSWLVEISVLIIQLPLVNLLNLSLLEEIGSQPLSLLHLSIVLGVSVRVQRHLFSYLSTHLVKEGIFVVLGFELLMDHFESVAHGVVFTLKRPETCKNLVIDAFDQHDLFKRVVVLANKGIMIHRSHDTRVLRSVLQGDLRVTIEISSFDRLSMSIIF